MKARLGSRIGFISFLLVLFLAIPALAQGEPFRVVNRTTEPATALHAVRSGRPDWGGNLLNRGPLAPGRFFALRPAEGAGCAFDIRMVLQDGQEIRADDKLKAVFGKDRFDMFEMNEKLNDHLEEAG